MQKAFACPKMRGISPAASNLRSAILTAGRSQSFVGMPIPAETRASLAARMPAWLDAIVHARDITERNDEPAIIEAAILAPNDADLQICGFAAACIAFDAGRLKAVPMSYLIRFGARGSVRIMMDFDPDAASWFGDAETIGDG